MNITFFEPLSRGWNRMTSALFKPFDLSKWFAVGFTAFLAGLTDFHGHGGGNGNGSGHGDLTDFFAFPKVAWEWLLDNPGWFALIIFGVFFLFCFIVLLTWLSSRGKFMFLHNVVHDTKEIAKPWREYSKEGNSLFLWRFVFGLICTALFITFFVFCFIIAFNIYEGIISKQVMVLYIVGMILLFLLMIIVTGYIALFLNDFIVPIMYKHNIKTTKAWSKFLPLFSKNILYFIFYGILIFFLAILTFIIIIVFGLCSCCIGFILLIIPYIGSVVLLPISYTFRAFSIEFLAQFGTDFSVFPVKKK